MTHQPVHLWFSNTAAADPARVLTAAMAVLSCCAESNGNGKLNNPYISGKTVSEGMINAYALPLTSCEIQLG